MPAAAELTWALILGLARHLPEEVANIRDGGWQTSIGADLSGATLGILGLGLLGFESAIRRDYPVMFGTLYVFGLMGLLVGIISDLTYVLVDPRIDFESRAG
mgnify:CR=1 FL=1